MVLDIDATVKGKEPNFNLISKLASECRMPLCYGGGITNAEIGGTETHKYWCRKSSHQLVQPLQDRL